MPKPIPVTLPMILRNRHVIVTCVVWDADLSVGIMSRSADDIFIRDVDTDQMYDFELTDAEIQEIDYAADVEAAKIEDKYMNDLFPRESD